MKYAAKGVDGHGGAVVIVEVGTLAVAMWPHCDLATALRLAFPLILRYNLIRACLLCFAQALPPHT